MVELMEAARLPDDHPALVPDLWARAMLSHRSVTPEARAAALKAAHLPPELPQNSTLKLTQAHEAIMLEVLARALGDPAFGARAGVEHDPHNGSILGYLAFSASTLREMMQLVVRYLPITRSRSRISIDETSLGATIELGFGDVALAGQEQFGEFALGSVLAMMRAAVGINVPLDWVSVADPQRLEPGELETIYRCRIYRDVPRFAIALPTRALDLPVQGADEKLLQHLTAYGDILLAQRTALASGILEEVEDAIVMRLSHGAPSQADIADQMGISTRTLARRLEREGHSYREVLERVRYGLARGYLADARLPLAEIAFMLGFADQSSFGTAFLRWSGFTPGHYRRTL
ncbi:helix-turn-helix transcriptional regulator [Marinibacterium profundimaris]|uniref:helix-turn-helix transcriptional regulator n=1 Tax=Marinibacterium profundimaris TaxID=1679460 RepID=UPI001303B3CC|nr:AraC family transcriptional regulator [Marinibacterium profundimaris]